MQVSIQPSHYLRALQAACTFKFLNQNGNDANQSACRSNQWIDWSGQAAPSLQDFRSRVHQPAHPCSRPTSNARSLREVESEPQLESITSTTLQGGSTRLSI